MKHKTTSERYLPALLLGRYPDARTALVALGVDRRMLSLLVDAASQGGAIGVCIRISKAAGLGAAGTLPTVRYVANINLDEAVSASAWALWLTIHALARPGELRADAMASCAQSSDGTWANWLALHASAKSDEGEADALVARFAAEAEAPTMVRIRSSADTPVVCEQVKAEDCWAVLRILPPELKTLGWAQ